MKISEMLLWILSTTLLALFVSAHYWGEHQRRESLAPFAEAGQAAAIDWLSDAHADEAVPAMPLDSSALPGTMDTVGTDDVQVLDDTGESMRTMVTCYPLHVIGNEPARYIVRAAVPDRSM